MSIDKDRFARDMDLVKSMRMGMDECHVALRESYADLADKEFWSYPLEGRNNIVTIIMHCLQQHDDFNGNLQSRLNRRARHEWHFLKHEERFGLWGLPPEKLPKPGDVFPSVNEVVALHDELHENIIRNMTELPAEEFESGPAGQWPKLCDMFFRGIYHVNAHIRQIWFLRGLMGIDRRYPLQHFA
ncbi:MAG: DinB family protein [Planctomycetota bacterium]|jgi:hypothetical protein|nr:DinB family protein [Planctomycetota bacterium]